MAILLVDVVPILVDYSMPLSAILDKLLDYAAQLQPTIREHMQSGYDISTIRRIVPFDLPPEVVELYHWHNGTAHTDTDPWLHQLFYYHSFLPLEEAYQTYQELMQVNQDIGIEGYSPHLFPLFTFMGEYYSVWFDEPLQETGAIYFVFQGEGKVYDNLASMLTAILECYETGAYTIQGNDTVVDQVQVAAIKAKWNSCRYTADGTPLGYHP
jgi:SMI1/KNR4 family protein SUKH-1